MYYWRIIILRKKTNKLTKIKNKKVKAKPSKKQKLYLLPKFSNPLKANNINYCNRVYSKSICLKINFSNKLFLNANLRGSKFKNCKFNSAKFICIDFNGVIFKKAKFVNVIFKKCLFYGTIFDDCSFLECNFENCVFINTNIEEIGIPENKNTILTYPPKISLSEQTLVEIERYKKIKKLSVSRLLHIKGGKLNNATFYVIHKKVTDEEKILSGLSKVFSNPESKQMPHTSHGLLEAIEKSINFYNVC